MEMKMEIRLNIATLPVVTLTNTVLTMVIPLTLERMTKNFCAVSERALILMVLGHRLVQLMLTLIKLIFRIMNGGKLRMC
tara:strand:+ start:1631 stop:1870 length:240 start_codon:yes stop_codon:yes gene_type:complete